MVGWSKSPFNRCAHDVTVSVSVLYYIDRGLFIPRAGGGKGCQNYVVDEGCETSGV